MFSKAKYVELKKKSFLLFFLKKNTPKFARICDNVVALDTSIHDLDYKVY